MKGPYSPIADSKVSETEGLERSPLHDYFRFIKLIGCDNKQVGEFSKLVKFRNRIANPIVTTLYNDQQAIHSHIAQVLIEIVNIQPKIASVLQELFCNFLCSDSNDPEKREAPDVRTEIEISLLHQYYLSQKAIDP